VCCCGCGVGDECGLFLEHSRALWCRFVTGELVGFIAAFSPQSDLSTEHKVQNQIALEKGTN